MSRMVMEILFPTPATTINHRHICSTPNRRRRRRPVPDRRFYPTTGHFISATMATWAIIGRTNRHIEILLICRRVDNVFGRTTATIRIRWDRRTLIRIIFIAWITSVRRHHHHRIGTMILGVDSGREGICFWSNRKWKWNWTVFRL